MRSAFGGFIPRALERFETFGLDRGGVAHPRRWGGQGRFGLNRGRGSLPSVGVSPKTFGRSERVASTPGGRVRSFVIDTLRDREGFRRRWGVGEYWLEGCGGVSMQADERESGSFPMRAGVALLEAGARGSTFGVEGIGGAHPEAEHGFRSLS